MLRSRVGLTGFSMKSKAPRLHGRNRGIDAALRGQQDDGDLLGSSGDVLQQFHAVHARHLQIGDHDRRAPGSTFASPSTPSLAVSVS